jgi:predicted hydrocarbon binding protein
MVETTGTSARVAVTGELMHTLLCASTAGLLSGIVGHREPRGVQVHHPTCAAKKQSRCVFEVHWSSDGD